MAQLQLSAQLMNDIGDVLLRHDTDARDPGIMSQYLAALLGFTVAGLQIDSAEKRELVEELSAFALHVLKDVEQQSHQAPPGGDQPAYGKWRPGDP